MAAPQFDPASGGPLAYFGTFLVASVFYGVTAFIAARFVLGDVPIKRTLAVGPALGLLSLLLQRFGPAVVIPISVVVDFLALGQALRLDRRTAAIVTVVHFTVAVILGITVLNLVRLLATAPG